MNKWIKVGLLLVPALLLGACGATGVKKGGASSTGGGAAAPSDGATTSPFGSGDGAAITPLPQTGGGATTNNAGVDPLNDPASPLAQRGDVRVTLEGHTDERGSREYNIALGERRANAVRDMMTLLGVSAGQISTVSYGEERPAMLGSDESAYAKNRRVEIVYAGR